VGARDRTQRESQLIALFGRAPIKRSTGMELSYSADGRAVFDLPHNPDLEHALHDTHGGVIAMLLDNAGWFTVARDYDTWVATVEMQMRILEPAKRENLRAMGRVIRTGKRISVAEMEVRSESGRLVAIGSGTFSVTSMMTDPTGE
jgi:uncharacterized protein (TIGR00369 family)